MRTDLPMTSVMVRHNRYSDVIATVAMSRPPTSLRARATSSDISGGSAGSCQVGSLLTRRHGNWSRRRRKLHGASHEASARVGEHNQYDNVRHWPSTDHHWPPL